jgi:aspartate aminotransferase
MQPVSGPVMAAAAELAGLRAFMEAYQRAVEGGEVVADMTFGNPHEMPLPGLVGALRTAIEPQAVDWFAYKTSEAEPRAIIADALGRELDLPFEPEDIAMTRGAFGAIGLAFSLLLGPGDECVIPVPGWFLYPAMLRSRGAVPVAADLGPDFDLDVAAVERAITPRTRIVVVNTPHNPTGVIYSRARLEQLAAMLTAKSAEIGHPIFILSDEPYRRIRFDGAPFTSPAQVYPHTLIDYSYGKVLLAPGLRLGYLAIAPTMPDETRQSLRDLAAVAQISEGWNFPDAPLQYAVPDLEAVSIDIAALQRRRDRLLGALTQWGYRMTRPAGTFYLWGEAPGGDAQAFAARLATRGVHVMPGHVMDRPGHFRICLTATDEMVEASLPAFRDAAG